MLSPHTQSAIQCLAPPTPAQLLRSIAANHRLFMQREARAAGGEVLHDAGVMWVHRPVSGATPGGATIPFPRLRARDAGMSLDAVLRHCRAIDGLRIVGCWSLSERTTPRYLGVQLMARGFEPGWCPHWMALDLTHLPDASHLQPGVRVSLVEDATNWGADTLLATEGARTFTLLTQARPRRVWHFVAWLEGQPVGQGALHVTSGSHGIAGIYGVTVLPAMRRLGIGSAIMHAALRHARTLGCRYAGLNATNDGEHLYRHLGFTSLGYGQTWWLHHKALKRAVPTPAEIAFVEAIGRGDIAALDRHASELTPAMLDEPLPCGETAVQLAVMQAQRDAATWLIAHGATLDVISAWDVGGEACAAAVLAATPTLANRTAGNGRTTPLHTAVLRDDAALARLILTANPDLSIMDRTYHSDALRWAHHLERTEIAAMIEQQTARLSRER